MSKPTPSPVTPTSSTPRMTEAQLQELVISLARCYHWRVAHFRAARTNKGYRTPVAADGAGFPDLLMLKNGRLVVVELKSDTGKVARRQEEWLEAFYWADAEIATWRPADWINGEILRVLSGGGEP